MSLPDARVWAIRPGWTFRSSSRRASWTEDGDDDEDEDDFAHRVLHDLGPVTDEEHPEDRSHHDGQEGPVELACTQRLS